MIPVHTRSEIGSDFDWASTESALGSSSALRPWAAAGEIVTYLESGRQALGVVSARLRAQGYIRLAMPSHYCESMLSPFVWDGWDVDFFPVSGDWRCVPSRVRHPEQTLIFSMAYFGVPESPEWLTFLQEQIGAGAKVLSDESHRVFDSGLHAAHFRVASLRKLLPVPDGAFLVGAEVEALRSGTQGDMRQQAMRTKSDYLRGLHTGGHRDLFLAAERMTDSQLTPATMSRATGDLLRRFAYPELRLRRKRNHRVLEEALTGSEFHVTTVHAPAPSHCVLEGERVPQLRQYLTERGIYCPVHWPKPDSQMRPESWRADVLSIPIDHRYDVNDMKTVAQAILAFEAEVQAKC